MALCTVSDVESIIGVDLSTTLESTVTNSLIPFADQIIKTYLGYDIEASNQTEVLFGDNNREINLKHIPVNSITSITEDGNSLTEGNESDFVFHSNGRVERVLGRWSGAKPKNITVVYNAGYSTIPDDIKFTSARISARILMSSLNVSSNADTGTVDTHLSDSTNGASMSTVVEERIGDLQVQYNDPLAYFDGPLLKDSDRLLIAPYKKQVFV
tara:strand:- start:1052 stop:1690 length:639 start_codon:yes stop_codon:yes gene_type:complete